MDPRFTLRPTLVLDQGTHLHAAGGGISAFAASPPTFFHSQLAAPSFQPTHRGFEQTLHSIDEYAVPASFPSSGQTYFSTVPLQRATTVFQERPASGVASGIGLTPGHYNMEVSALNSGYQLVSPPPGIAEVGPSGFQSVYAPSYEEVVSLGHGYGSNAPVYVYQRYPQAKIHSEPALLPHSNSLEFASRKQLLPEQGLRREYSNAGFLSRRREVDQRIKSERQRVLDHRRELQPRHEKAFPARERGPLYKLQTEKSRIESKKSGPNNSKGEGLQASRQKGNTWCSICQVECNSPQVLQSHIGGKKHKSQVEAKKLQEEDLKKKSAQAVKEAVEKNKEKIDGTKDQAIRKAKIEKGRRKKARRAERRRALEQEKAARDGTADVAIDKALLEIQKIGANLTVDGVHIELKTEQVLEDLKEVKVDAVEEFVADQKEVESEGVLKEGKHAEKLLAGKTFIAVNEMAEDKPSGEVEGGICEAKEILDNVKVECTEIQSKSQEAAELIEGNVRQDEIDSVKASTKVETKEDTDVAGMDLDKEDVLGNKSSLQQKKSHPLKSKKADVAAHVQSATVRCEVCAVTCRNAAVYETHLKGEKHAERLKKSAEGIKGKPAKVRKAAGK